MEKRHERRGLGEMQKLADARPGSSDSVVVIVLMPPPVTAEISVFVGMASVLRSANVITIPKQVEPSASPTV